MDSNVSKTTLFDKFFKLHLNFDSIAVKNLLQQQLWQAIQLYQQQNNCHVLSQSLIASIPAKISLSRRQKTKSNALKYRCAICFPLASQWQLSPLVLAEELITILTTIKIDCPQKIMSEFEIELIASGWIDFSLRESGLAIWLRQLIAFLETRATISENNRLSNHNSLFSIRYVHARCCSLLNLGQRENLIKLKDGNFTNYTWQIVHPRPLPWLSSQGNFLLNHCCDRKIIIELFKIVDLFASDESVDWRELAESLSQAMLNFEANCRIFGQINPELAQARLGLVALVQYFLALLLQQLGITPWNEL
jgi:hypothetical protein